MPGGRGLRGRALIVIGLPAFLVFGLVLVLPGASQDAMARALDLDLAASSLVGSLLLLGLGGGVVVAGPLCDRYPRRPLFLASVLVSAAAALGVHPDIGYAGLLALVALLGFGVGIYDTLLNALAVEGWGERSARPLGLLHAAVTLGAAGGPFAVAWLLRDGDWTAGFRAAGAVLLVLAVAVAFVPLPAPRGRRAGAGSAAVLRSPAFLALAGVGFAYVGIETSVGVLSVPYAQGALELSADRGRAGISAYWVGVLLARLGLMLRRRRIGTRYLVLSGLAGGLSVAASVGLRAPWIEAAHFATGLALGGVFPAMIAVAGERFPDAQGAAAGFVAGVASLGGFAVPWLAGGLGDARGVVWAFGSLALWSGGVAMAAWFVQGSQGGSKTPLPSVST